ncbi:unnamed protein product [Linum trigynum]|uniref:Uncharacterized protein n=1 Tax=Linum trigynum TaxID=586398 RepID=A0AAV2FPQ9_9ROSI
MAAGSTAADRFFRNWVFVASLLGVDHGIKGRSYHCNCRCALHKKIPRQRRWRPRLGWNRAWRWIMSVEGLFLLDLLYFTGYMKEEGLARDVLLLENHPNAAIDRGFGAVQRQR